MNIFDCLRVLGHLFLDRAPLPCAKAADATADGRVDLSDAVTLLSLLFGERPSLPAPFPNCGSEPTEDTLECSPLTRCTP